MKIQKAKLTFISFKLRKEIQNKTVSFFFLEGNHLRCSDTAEVKSLYLPHGDQNNNYSLMVEVTVKNDHEKFTTTIPTQVGCLVAVQTDER